MEHKEYDVVIVGSGISGSIIAKTLTNAGKKVLLLEAGLKAGIALDKEGSYETYQSYLDTYYKAAAKAPNAPYPDIKDAPSIDVLDLTVLDGKPSTDHGYLVQMGPVPFASDCVRGAGGTTLHWLGTTLRMLPNDFKMKTLYNQGVDWPITYDDLKPYYEMAEHEIGVSGEVSEQKMPNMGDNFWGEEYVFPMEKIPQSYMDSVLMQKTEGLTVSLNGKEYQITCISTPQGRNSNPNVKYKIAGVSWSEEKKQLELIRGDEKFEYRPKGALWDNYTGERCEGNASCVPICPVQAKYNALKTLKNAKKENLKIITQAVASSLMIEKGTNEIAGIIYKKYRRENSKRYTTEVAKGKIYVLAASAIENAKLLLASNAANSSDQVGRNLMDHLVMLTWGLTPEKIYPYRGPGSTTNIPTFRDGEFRNEHAAWISPLDNWGWSWPTFAPGSDVQAALEKGMFGKNLRNHIHDKVTRQFLLHFECEQSPEPENRVTIDPKYKDQIDNYRPVIHYNVSEYMRKSMEAAKKVSDQIFAANEIEDFTNYSKQNDPGYVEYKGQGYTFRGAGHIVGTHRMGSCKEDSVVNEDQRTWDHKNLFLVGCGNMPTLGTSNPTLTMSALTFKAAEAILKQLNQ